MALMLYGGGVTEVRGSVGGNTFSRGRGGATMRAKISPTQWRSDRRQIIKSALSTISGQWGSTLTEAERQAWNSFALVTPSTNVYGQTTYLSGHGWFCRCNSNLLACGASLITAPPLSATVPGITTLSVSPDHSAGGFVVLVTTNAGMPADFYWNLKMTAPISPGVYYVSNLLKQVNYIHNPLTTQSITTPYTDLFPNLPFSTGRKIFALISIIDGATGCESPAIIGSGIVT